MKIRIVSDTHNEFNHELDIHPIGEDVLILAGDIGVHTDGAVWGRNYARRHSVPVVMIAGNHEFYRNHSHPEHTVESTLYDLHHLAESEPLFNFLENDIVTINGVSFAGCTLWTDFALYGSENRQNSMDSARDGMNDYRLIRRRNGERFLPATALAMHQESVKFLRSQSVDVIVTHHLPSTKSISRQYLGSDLNPSYASNLDDLVAQSGAKLFIHGHTHTSHDYMIGDTRVVCNPFGYFGYEVNPDFDPDLLIEI